MAIEWVDEGPIVDVDAFMPVADHPSRRLLERSLGDPADETAWSDLLGLYEEQAPDWSAWVSENPHYLDALQAALDRLDVARDAIEVCCGTGNATAMIAAVSDRVLAIDASPAMLARVPDIANVEWRLADVRSIPAHDHEFDLVVGVNAVPWPPELTRICGPTGTILWVASFGADTPLYIQPERLAELLGPDWVGQAGTVGRGVWCTMTRRR